MEGGLHLADSFGDASGDLRAAARVDLRFQRGAGVEQLERRGEVIAQERAQLGEHIRLFLKPLQNLAAGRLDILNLSGKRRIGNRVVGGGNLIQLAARLADERVHLGVAGFRRGFHFHHAIGIFLFAEGKRGAAHARGNQIAGDRADARRQRHGQHAYARKHKRRAGTNCLFFHSPKPSCFVLRWGTLGMLSQTLPET